MNKVHKMKCLALSLFFILSLGACAGPDRPYTMAKNLPPPTSRNSGGATADEALGPCTPKIKDVSLKLTAATSSGIKESDPKSISDVILRFASSGDLTMKSTDFPASDINLSGVTLHVSLTNEVHGHYTATPALITLDDLVFQVSGFINGALPPLSLTTGHIDQAGNAGTLSKDGGLNPDDKTITLVGGAPIPQSLAPSGFEFLGGAALVVELSGTLESIPDISTCTAAGSGGNVQFKNVVMSAETPPREQELPLGATFDFGRIFVPEQGVDTNIDLNNKFVQERKLRVKVPAGKPELNANITSGAGFNITPNGNIHIPSGGQQDFTIRFSMPATSYTATSPAASTDASFDLNFGENKLTLTGKVKRAAPEMVMTTPTSTTVDLGNVIVPTRGSGAQTQITCQGNRSLVQQKVTLKNTGVRELQITRIVQPGPIDTSATPQRPDPGCQNFGTNGTEFAAMGLRWSNGAACAAGPAPGTLTGACRIPVGEGEVSFKVIYLPINASNIVNAQADRLVKDQAKLTVQSNDPRYSRDGLSLNFSGGISPDQSEILRIRKQITRRSAAGDRTSSIEVNKGGVIKIISEQGQNDATQLILVNKQNQALQIQSIQVPANSGFEVLNTSDHPRPSSVPASNAAGEDGTASFWVRLNPSSGANNHKVFNAPLSIVFSAGTGQASTFTVNLVGSLDLPPLEGYVDITIEKVNSYIDNTFTRDDTVDSLDYRIKGRTVKPGALRLRFVRTEGNAITKVTIVPAIPNFVPTQEGQLARMIKNLPRSEREKLFRVYTTRMSGLNNVGYHQDGDRSNNEQGAGDGEPDCVDPVGPLGTYPQNNPTDCSYFYYILANRGTSTGFYDPPSGQLIMQDLDMRFVNPYHFNPGAFDAPESVIDLKATLSTFDIRSPTLNTRDIFGEDLPEAPLVVSPGIGPNDISLPTDPAGFGRILEDGRAGYQRCPEIREGDQVIKWSPVDPRFEPHTVRDQALEPRLLCNVTEAAPYYLTGFPVTPQELENGEVVYRVVLTLLTRYGGGSDTLPGGYPQGVPGFLQDSRMWITLHGTIHQCGTGTTEHGPCLPMAPASH